MGWGVSESKTRSNGGRGLVCLNTADKKKITYIHTHGEHGESRLFIESIVLTARANETHDRSKLIEILCGVTTQVQPSPDLDAAIQATSWPPHLSIYNYSTQIHVLECVP